MEIHTADISFKECLLVLKELASEPHAFIDEIPEVLKDDFKAFIVGNTLSTIDGREITYDMKKYYNKLMYGDGISYRIKWAE